MSIRPAPMQTTPRFRSAQMVITLVLGVFGAVSSMLFLDLVPPVSNLLAELLVTVLAWAGREGSRGHWVVGVAWLAVGLLQLIPLLGLPVAWPLSKRPSRGRTSAWDVLWAAWAIVATLAACSAVALVVYTFPA